MNTRGRSIDAQKVIRRILLIDVIPLETLHIGAASLYKALAMARLQATPYLRPCLKKRNTVLMSKLEIYARPGQVRHHVTELWHLGAEDFLCEVHCAL